MRPSNRLIALFLILATALVTLAVIFPQTERLALIAVLGGVFVIALDMALAKSRRNLEVGLDVPSLGFVATPAKIKLNVHAKKGKLPHKIETKLSHDPEIELVRDFDVFGNEAEAELESALQLKKRGHYNIQAIDLKWPSPFGLFEIIARFKVDNGIDVQPNIQPITSGAIQTQLLPLQTGIKDFHFKGEGSEFHQLREFVSGMDPRSLDWKRSAKMQKLVAREVRAERNHHIAICVDNGYLMSQQTAQSTKLDGAINAALALCWASGIGGDEVSFYNFNSHPGQFIPPRPGREAFPVIRARASNIEYNLAESNHTWGLSFLNGKLKRRSLVVVFSDFVDSTSAEMMVESLNFMRKQHLVLYVSLRDHVLQRFIDAPSEDLDDVAKAIAAKQIRDARETTLETMRQKGILVLNCAPSELTTKLISRYMDIKLQELI